MYRVVIADDDVLMREALRVLVSRDPLFEAVLLTGSGEEALKYCRRETVDLLFLAVLMCGMTGLETSRLIHQESPQTMIYLIAEHSSGFLIHSLMKDYVKEVIEKPVSASYIRKLLSNYKSEHEGLAYQQMEELMGFLRSRDFSGMYTRLTAITREIYQASGGDMERLLKICSFVGQNLLNTSFFYEDESREVGYLFPLNEGMIQDQRAAELWLFRVMDYIFRRNGAGRYPWLENVFIYMEEHIKEDITLNKIIENCAISQGYLSRVFREQFHCSVMEYLHMKKLHLAKGYFCFTDNSIAEVAYRLGYNESSYFSKVFKKYEHMTVKQYKAGAGKAEVHLP